MRHFLPQTTLEMAKTAKGHQFANFNISKMYQRRQEPTLNFNKMHLLIKETNCENIYLVLCCAGFQKITFPKIKNVQVCMSIFSCGTGGAFVYGT